MRRRRGARRAEDQARQIGREVLVARKAVGLSMSAAARRAGVSRSTWERVERGSPAITLRTLCAATDAVGRDVVLRAYPGRGPSLRDRGQMELVQYLNEVAHASWTGTLEVTAGEFGQAIDQVFWGPLEILAVEVIRHMGDYQGQYRSASLKRDWLAAHHALPVRLILVVEDLRSNRAVLAPHLGLIRSVMPAGSREVMHALRTGAALGSDGLMWIRRPAVPAPRRSIGQ